jgi:DNA-binding transcriptional ArsR family regulator
MSRAVAHADVFQAIADPTRRGILARLAAGEQPVGTLARHFDVTLPAISQHLRVLRDAGLVTVRPAGRERWYRLQAAPLRPVAEWIAEYEPFWRGRLDALGAHLDGEARNEKGDET